MKSQNAGGASTTTTTIIQMRRQNEYSPDFKRQVVEEYQRGGVTRGALGQKYGLPMSTLDSWIALNRRTPPASSPKGQAGGEAITIQRLGGKYALTVGRITIIEDSRKEAIRAALELDAAQ